jgi:hypothetical protein
MFVVLYEKKKYKPQPVLPQTIKKLKTQRAGAEFISMDGI